MSNEFNIHQRIQTVLKLNWHSTQLPRWLHHQTIPEIIYSFSITFSWFISSNKLYCLSYFIISHTFPKRLSRHSQASLARLLLNVDKRALQFYDIDGRDLRLMSVGGPIKMINFEKNKRERESICNSEPGIKEVIWLKVA